MAKPAEHSECSNYEYKCHEGKCIHNDWLCDGTEDCPQGDDEAPSCRKYKHLYIIIRSFTSLESLHFTRKMR